MSDKKPLINFSDAESDSCEDEPAFHSQSHHTEYVSSAVSDSKELSALIDHDCNSLLTHSVMDRAIGMVSECESGSRENVTYSESAYSNSQHRMDIEPEHNNKQCRMGIEPEHNSSEHRIGIEPDYNNKEHRMGTELEQNSQELKMNAELEHNTPEHIRGSEPAHKSAEHKMSTSLVHNSTEHKMGSEHVHNSPEQRLDSEWKLKSTENLICFEAVDISTEHRINTDFKHEIIQQRMNTESEPQITENKMDINREKYGLSQESQPYTKDSEMPAEYNLDSTEHQVALEDNNKKLVGTGQMHTNYDRDSDSVLFSTQHGFTQPDHGILPPSWNKDPHNSCGVIHGQEDECIISAEENSHGQSHNLSHQSAFGNTQTSHEIQNAGVSQRPNSSTAILDTVERPHACASFDAIENGQRLNPASLELIHADNQSAAKSDADNVSSALSETMLSYDRSAPSDSSSSFDQIDDEYMDNLLGKLDSPQPDSWLQEHKSPDDEMPEVPEEEKCPSEFIVSMICEDLLLEKEVFRERNELLMDRCLEEKDETERSLNSAENAAFQDAQKLDNDLRMTGITNEDYQKALEICNLAPNSDNGARTTDLDLSSDLFGEDSFSTFQQMQNIGCDIMPETGEEPNDSYEMSQLTGDRPVHTPASLSTDPSSNALQISAAVMFGLGEESTDNQLNFFFDDESAASADEKDSDISDSSDLSTTYARNIRNGVTEQIAEQDQESDKELKTEKGTTRAFTGSNSSMTTFNMDSHHLEECFVERNNKNHEHKPEHCISKIAKNVDSEEYIRDDDCCHKVERNSFAQQEDQATENFSIRDCKNINFEFMDKMEGGESAENNMVMDDFSLIHLSDISNGENSGKVNIQDTTAMDDFSLFEHPSEPQKTKSNEVSFEKKKECGDFLLIDFSDEPQGEVGMKTNCKNIETNLKLSMPISSLEDAEGVSLYIPNVFSMMGLAKSVSKSELETNIVHQFAACESTTKNNTDDDGFDNDDGNSDADTKNSSDDDNNGDNGEDTDHKHRMPHVSDLVLHNCPSQECSGINDVKQNTASSLKIPTEEAFGLTEDVVTREAVRLKTKTENSHKLNPDQTIDFLNKGPLEVLVRQQAVDSHLCKPATPFDLVDQSQMSQGPASTTDHAYNGIDSPALNQTTQPCKCQIHTSDPEDIHAHNTDSHLSLPSMVSIDEQNASESSNSSLSRQSSNNDCACDHSCSSAKDTGYHGGPDHKSDFGFDIPNSFELNESELSGNLLSGQSPTPKNACSCSQCLDQSYSTTKSIGNKFSPDHGSKSGLSISSYDELNESESSHNLLSCSQCLAQSYSSVGSTDYQPNPDYNPESTVTSSCSGTISHPYDAYVQQSGRQLCRDNNQTVQVGNVERNDPVKFFHLRPPNRDQQGKKPDPAFSTLANDKVSLNDSQGPHEAVISSLTVSSQDSELKEMETSFRTSDSNNQRTDSYHHHVKAEETVGNKRSEGKGNSMSSTERIPSTQLYPGVEDDNFHHQQQQKRGMHQATESAVHHEEKVGIYRTTEGSVHHEVDEKNCMPQATERTVHHEVQEKGGMPQATEKTVHHEVQEKGGIPQATERTVHHEVQKEVGMQPEVEEQGECIRTVQVHGLTAEDELLCRLYFENKRRSGGGAIKDDELKWDSKLECFILTFEDITVAKTVVTRKHTLSGKDIHVEVWKAPLYYNDSILLSGVPLGTTEDLIQNFLESIADVSVASVQLNKSNGEALVAFEQGPIDVSVLRQLCQENKLNDNIILSVHSIQVSDTILVKNINPGTNNECIRFFFMNKNRNKGGPIRKVERLNETTALVYFQNPKDAEAVVDKRGHMLDGNSLQVSPHITHFSSDSKSSTSETTPATEDMPNTSLTRSMLNETVNASPALEMGRGDYLERSRRDDQSAGLSSSSMNPSQCYDHLHPANFPRRNNTVQMEGVGLINMKENCTFIEKSDDRRFVKQENHQSEMSCDLNRNLPKYSSSLCERRNSTDTRYTSDQMNENAHGEMQFQSTKCFPNEEACSHHRHPQRSRSQNSNKTSSQVYSEENSTYYKERNFGNHHTVPARDQRNNNTPPAPSNHIFQYIIKTLVIESIKEDIQAKKELMAILRSVNCRYEWIENPYGILVNCIQTHPPPNWKMEVEKMLDKFILKISVKLGDGMIPLKEKQHSPSGQQPFKRPQHIPEVSKVTQQNNVPQQFPVSHFQEKSSGEHEKYEGEMSERKNTSPKASCTSDSNLARNTSNITASVLCKDSFINLKKHQIKFLSQLQAMTKLKAQHTNVNIYLDETAGTLKLQAPEDIQTKTKSNILSFITNISEKRISLSPAQIAMYRKKDTQEYVNKMLDENEIICHWEVFDSCILLTAIEDDHRKLNNFFSTFFKEDSLSVLERHVSVFKTETWETFLTKLQQPGTDCLAPLVKVDLQNNAITIVGIAENVEKTKQLLQDFLFKMKIEEKNISMSANHYKFLTQCHTEKLKGMIDKARKAGVTLSLNNGAFVAEGPSNDVSRVHAFVKSVLISIDFQKKTFTGPGVAKYLLSPTGQDWLQHIGQTMHCLITTVSDQNAVSGSQVLASCHLGTQVQLDIVQGDITQCDVGAIVNAANNELLHGGGVAGAIVSAGGESIQEECTQIVKERGSIPDGSVVVSKPGTLQCSYILHAVGPVWKGGNKGEENVLMETIQNVLKEAEKMKLTTLAMPAISCGIFNYPPHSATLAILRTIKEHFEKGASESCLRSIVLIDTNADPLKAFISSAKQLFGKKVEVKAEPRETNAGFFKSIVSTAKQFFGTKDEGSAGPKETTHREHRWEGVGKSWAGSPKSHTKHNGNKKSGLPIRIIPGEIAKSRTDVIVCTVHPSLDLKKGVLSRNILDEGGARIQEELQKVFASRGPVQAGKVIKTSGGDLQCKNLFHISLPSWKEDRGQVLKSAVHECLDSAQKVRAKSLAFPALGTGKLGYPSDEAAKIMFTTISKWFHENQDTCIQEVQIIVYSKDKDVLQAFKQAEQHGGRQHKGSNSDHTERRRTQADISGPLKTQVGKLRVIVKQGNILSESCEAIVNSSNDSLDLSKGAVSKAIREACGDDIIVQCSKQKGNMEDTGIAMTGVPAGSLACGNIIHISADRFKRDWHKGVLKVLQTADTNHLQSVALPALGTGGRSANPKQLAQSMQQAVVEFADEARYVKEVRIIIFQSELLSHYCTAFDSSSVPAGAEAAAQSDEEVQETENKPWKDVEVYVYSDKKDAIEEAFDKVSTRIKESTTSKEEKDTLISKFDKQQRSEVLLLQTKHDVEIQLDEKASRVKITGFEIDVARASSDLKTIMFKASKERHLAAGMPPVRWQYEVGSNKYKDFDPEQTLEIEAAFKKREQSVMFSDKKGNKYKIVFKEKLEYLQNDRDSNPVKVRRRDILHEKSQELPLPSHWAPMKKDEKVKVVDLDPSSNEYKRVAQHFGGISDLVGGLGNMPHLRSQAGTLKIQRIQNPSLFQAFKIKKSELEKFNTNTKENEQRLWHGTDSNNIQGIITNGFNRSYCGRNGTAYGDGVYFAVNSSTSMGYARGRQMFQARVLVGESTPGRSGMRTPPQKPGSDRLYDSLSGPGMFIIFHDSQAYPEYLLTF